MSQAALQRRRCLVARPGHGSFPFGLGAVDENGNPRLVELLGLGFSFVGKWKNHEKS